MKARIRNALWVVTLLVGLALYVLPAIALVVFFVSFIAAVLLTIPRVSSRRAPHGRHEDSDPQAELNAKPDFAITKHDPRGGGFFR